MELAFNAERVRYVEFGIGVDRAEHEEFYYVQTSSEVQSVLVEMVRRTCARIDELLAEKPEQLYNPSEKYASEEYLLLPIDNDVASLVRRLHESSKLAPGATLLGDPHAKVFCYFARLADEEGNRLTAIRRAGRFRLVKRPPRIMVLGDELKLVNGKLFKLDEDFDVLVDSGRVHILRAAGFEFVGRITTAILAAVPHNVEQIKSALPFLDMSNIEDYARRRPRAARYLASIRTYGRPSSIDRDKLLRYCQVYNIGVGDANGKIRVDDRFIMQFLRLLDRRLFAVDLSTTGELERYMADSRRPYTGPAM